MEEHSIFLIFSWDTPVRKMMNFIPHPWFCHDFSFSMKWLFLHQLFPITFSFTEFHDLPHIWFSTSESFEDVCLSVSAPIISIHPFLMHLYVDHLSTNEWIMQKWWIACLHRELCEGSLFANYVCRLSEKRTASHIKQVYELLSFCLVIDECI